MVTILIIKKLKWREKSYQICKRYPTASKLNWNKTPLSNMRTKTKTTELHSRCGLCWYAYFAQLASTTIRTCITQVTTSIASPLLRNTNYFLHLRIFCWLDRSLLVTSMEVVKVYIQLIRNFFLRKPAVGKKYLFAFDFWTLCFIEIEERFIELYG